MVLNLLPIGLATVLATGNNPPKPNTAPSLASPAVRIALGAGLVAVVEAKVSCWESFLALSGFCVLASASYLAMEITRARSCAARARGSTTQRRASWPAR